MYFLANPKAFLKATETKYELVYLLVDGDRAGTYVLASGVRNNGIEETALFPCADEFGAGVIYDPIVTTNRIDDEGALNLIGYTARLAKHKNKS
jgi:hypothetical protein